MTAPTILVTGSSGFLGKHVVRRLKQAGHDKPLLPSHDVFDLTNPAAVKAMLAKYRPQIVIHLAAVCGGIGFNQRELGRLFYANACMGLHLIEESRRAGVAKFISIGTICSYPKNTPVPFKESTLWDGYPDESNAAYGLAKKMLLVQAQAYKAQYGFNSINLLLANLFGPGDSFDPHTSHVIPALIRNFVAAREARAPSVSVWGTGEATRDFLYVDDAAGAIVAAVEKPADSAEPINVGTGRAISIAALAGILAGLIDYQGTILFDGSKPNGQPRRQLDVGRAAALLGWRPQTSLEAGLRETVAWYAQNR